MDCPAAESGETVNSSGGEIEIEKLPLHEVEIRRRELLPVFKQFHYSDRNSSGRDIANGFHNASYHTGDAQYSSVKDNGEYEAKPVAPISGFYPDMRKVANMNGLARQPLSGPSSAVDLKQVGKCNNIEFPNASSLAAQHKAENNNNGCVSTSPERNASIRSLSSHSLLDGPLDPASSASCKPETANNSVLNNVASTVIPNGCLTTVHSGQQEASDSHNSVEFIQYFQEGYCKISELDDCRELTEAVTDADSSSSHCEREKPEEDGDNDDMLGGVFAFSEEG